MIRRIEALNFRCLRYVSQKLENFQVLVGPNASGKTTFLDVVAFLGDFVTGDLDRAISERTQNFQDLVWGRSGNSFELAVELEIPEKRRQKIEKNSYFIVRYEVSIGLSINGELSILAEKVLLKEENNNQNNLTQRTLFPVEPSPKKTIISAIRVKKSKKVKNKK